MPIHDQGYRRYGGGKDARGQAWLVIARAGIRTMVARRLFLALLLVSWVRFLYECIRVYLTTNFGQFSVLATTAQTFREFLEFQEVFVFFITIYVGAGLISNDRRANALQIYLSKPLTRFEYVAGKAATLAVFLLGVTWVPAMLLLVIQGLFAGSFAFIREHLFLLPAITVYAFLQVMLATFAMLALSSMSKSARFVGIMYAGPDLLHRRDLRDAEVPGEGQQRLAGLADAESGAAGRRDLPRAAATRHAGRGVAAGDRRPARGVSIVILERKVRGVEVVA